MYVRVIIIMYQCMYIFIAYNIDVSDLFPWYLGRLLDYFLGRLAVFLFPRYSGEWILLLPLLDQILRN